MRAERIHVVRDWCTVAVGLGIIVQQAVIVQRGGQVSEPLLVVAVTLLTAPAVAGAAGLRRDAGTGDGSGSPGPPSSPPASSSPCPPYSDPDDGA